jgi:hypothetical protein
MEPLSPSLKKRGVVVTWKCGLELFSSSTSN